MTLTHFQAMHLQSVTNLIGCMWFYLINFWTKIDHICVKFLYLMLPYIILLI